MSSLSASALACILLHLISYVCEAREVPLLLATDTITPPPAPLPSSCQTKKLQGRADTCSFGSCGTTCLEQGAFCCGPAGTLAVDPLWICDNGACITSVRGASGIVDCYDPDNPSGTTQSCIDNVPTTTCHSTDRCYTCSSDVPYCHWQTYIAPGSPTLSWFSCTSERKVAETYVAASITYVSTPVKASATALTSTSATPSPLSTNEIIGIGVGGGLVVLAIIAVIVWCCLRRRDKGNTTGMSSPGKINTTMAELPSPPSELPTRGSYFPDGSTEIHTPRTPSVTHIPGQFSPEPYTEDFWRSHSPYKNPPAVELPAPHMPPASFTHNHHAY